MEYEIQNNTEPSDSPNTPSASTTSTSEHDTIPATEALFTSLHNYPFSQDPGFLGGLSQIFGHPGVAVTPAELSQKPDLVTSAKCFYYSRKFQILTPVDPDAYKAWLASQSSSIPAGPSTQQPPIPSFSSTPSTAAPATQQATSSTPSSELQPPYPTSFAAIVELITNNKPIPGIEEIPDTVLEPGSSRQDHATRRRKPWEKDDVDTEQGVGSAGQESLVQTAGSNMDTNGGGQGEVGHGQVQRPREDEDVDRSQTVPGQSEGLLRLLKPGAVPDSGLIAKD